MKNILLIIMLLSVQWLMAQDCGETPNGISTNPDNPINDECGGIFKNYFDWRTPTYNVPFYQGTSSGQIGSPFFESNGKIEEIHNTNDFPGAKDFKVEDGWELIVDGITETQATQNTSKIAYLVLYNKYTATLRVFGAHHDIGNNDYMSINLKFTPNDNGDVSGLFHPTTQIAQPLDQKSISAVHANAKISGDNPLHFFYADFPMGYDPCTCILNRGNIVVSFDAVNTQLLEVYGRSWAIDGTLADITSGKLNSSGDYLMNVYSNGADAKAGSLIFNNLNELETLYETQKSNAAQLNKQYQFIKNLKLVLSLGSSGPSQEDYYKKEVIPYLKTISKVVDVMSMPLKKKVDGANGAVAATGKVRVIQSEMTFSGSITDVTGKEDFTFRLPGRTGNSTECDTLHYPKYNEVLGRFAILETPKVKVSGIRTVYNNFGAYDNKFQFEDSSLIYMFNPAAQINETETEIYGALVIKNNPNCNFVPMDLFNIERIESLSDGVSSTVHMTPVVPIECLEKTVSETISITNYNCNPNYEILLRLVIFYEFNSSDGNSPRRAFEIITYPMNIEFEDYEDYESFDAASILPANTTGAIPYNANLTTTNYTVSQDFFAWDTIFIDGDLTANSGVEVEISAPVIIINNGSIGQGITLIEKETPFINCTKIQPFTYTGLSDYCNGENPAYQANKPKNAEIIANSVKDKPTKPIPFKSSPNPFTNSFNIEFELDTESVTNLMVFDALGRIVESVVVDTNLGFGKHQYQIDSSRLESGVYYVQLRTNNGSQTIKIIKQ